MKTSVETTASLLATVWVCESETVTGFRRDSLLGNLMAQKSAPASEIQKEVKSGSTKAKMSEMK